MRLFVKTVVGSHQYVVYANNSRHERDINLKAELNSRIFSLTSSDSPTHIFRLKPQRNVVKNLLLYDNHNSIMTITYMANHVITITIMIIGDRE